MMIDGGAAPGKHRVTSFELSACAPVPGASSSNVWALRTTIGVAGAPKRATTSPIHCAVDLLSQPRCCPQLEQVSSPTCGSRAAPMVQTLRQHGRSRSMGRSSFSLRPIKVGAPNRSVLIRALLARPMDLLHVDAAKRRARTQQTLKQNPQCVELHVRAIGRGLERDDEPGF